MRRRKRRKRILGKRKRVRRRKRRKRILEKRKEVRRRKEENLEKGRCLGEEREGGEYLKRGKK